MINLLNDFVLYFLGSLHEVAGIDPVYDSVLAVIVLSTVLITACLIIVAMVFAVAYRYFMR